MHTIEVEYKSLQTYEYAIDAGDEVGQPMVTIEEEIDSSKEKKN